MSSFNKAKLKVIRADINAALASVEAKHKLKFNLGRITYTSNDFRVKLEGLSTGGSANSADADRIQFESKAYLAGVKKTAFGEKFTSNGRTFTIDGLNLRANKYPIKATDSRGRRYKFSVRSLPASLRV